MQVRVKLGLIMVLLAVLVAICVPRTLFWASDSDDTGDGSDDSEPVYALILNLDLPQAPGL